MLIFFTKLYNYVVKNKSFTVFRFQFAFITSVFSQIGLPYMISSFLLVKRVERYAMLFLHLHLLYPLWCLISIFSILFRLSIHNSRKSIYSHEDSSIQKSDTSLAKSSNVLEHFPLFWDLKSGTRLLQNLCTSTRG